MMPPTKQPRDSGTRSTNRWLAAFGALTLVAVTLAGTNYAAHARTLATQQAQITQLTNDSAKQSLQAAAGTARSVQDGLGISPDRVSTDTAIITQLLSTAFTWNSGESYGESREAVKARYDLAEGSRFLTTFMPPAGFNQDKTGRKYYYIDAAGLSSNVGGNVDVDVVEIAGTSYRYAVMADLVISGTPTSSTSGAGQTKGTTASVTRRMLLYVTVAADGTVSELTGYPASGDTRTSP
ncbi:MULTISPECIES: hypothetical protein [Arthrobacter]|uniref:Uncharacterized protein n=1 Tax=Arthrobacter terricola TaxID=2547396 RepID=A0A4R5KAG3_9MICC|nr:MULTISPECIES: hypothetical protein [Arthrobacter]MBT8163352.1 hypothetical protein [Arthrobacter sp. GN70]TDF90555.1 hypothetical protein E1809_22105 [Arthrobacter terricola]